MTDPEKKIPYDKVPLQFKVRIGVREDMQSIENWQDKMRAQADLLIQKEKQKKPPENREPNN